jgi:hypothetical protein
MGYPFIILILGWNKHAESRSYKANMKRPFTFHKSAKNLSVSLAIHSDLSLIFSVDQAP